MKSVPVEAWDQMSSFEEITRKNLLTCVLRFYISCTDYLEVWEGSFHGTGGGGGGLNPYL
jgi:hypothetical protein